MKIEHVAVWTDKLEELKDFYIRSFNAHASEKYINKKKQFESYFLTFDSGCRLELMTTPEVINRPAEANPFIGLTHFAISVGSKARVDLMTEEFRRNGVTIAGEPRTTGDGYYESVILDPDGNKIEITI
jgi:catechol 2,3-dioxygenase-like lactoylglutathione lyase family enzyme